MEHISIISQLELEVDEIKSESQLTCAHISRLNNPCLQSSTVTVICQRLHERCIFLNSGLTASFIFLQFMIRRRDYFSISSCRLGQIYRFADTVRLVGSSHQPSNFSLKIHCHKIHYIVHSIPSKIFAPITTFVPYRFLTSSFSDSKFFHPFIPTQKIDHQTRSGLYLSKGSG